MVEDGGDALLDAVDVEGVGGGLGAGQGQAAVNGPPGAVQNLIEIGGIVALDGKSAGKGRVDMRMGVDESRHDNATLGVNKFRIGILCLQIGGFADFFDFCAVDDHTAVRQIGECFASGDQLAVCKNVHGVYLLKKTSEKQKMGM